MLRLNSKVTITATEFTIDAGGASFSIDEVKTEFNTLATLQAVSTWETLLDTLAISLPNNFKRDNKPITVGQDGFFKRGDAIKVEVGYFPTFNLIFEGFIRTIKLENTIVIEAEDEGYKLKQINNNFTLKDTDLETLTDTITAGQDITSEIVKAKIGDFKAKNVTSLQVLQELKKTYGLISYFRDKTLNIGLAYNLTGAKHTFYLEGIDNGNPVQIQSQAAGNDENIGLIIDDALEYIDAQEVKLYIEGKSMQDDNALIEQYATYDPDGKLVYLDKAPAGQKGGSFTVPGITKSELKERIAEMLKNAYSTGITGGFTTFSEPAVKHGDEVTLISYKFPEKAGTFLVKKVATTFGTGGGRQQIELDRQIN